MKKFTYLETFETGNRLNKPTSVQDYLNEKGQNGWELVTIVPTYFTDGTPGIATWRFFFKKEINPK